VNDSRDALKKEEKEAAAGAIQRQSFSVKERK